MTKLLRLMILLALAGIGCRFLGSGQDADRASSTSKVDMVVLSFTVTDAQGPLINGLKPSDFKSLRRRISQKLATFAEGNTPPCRCSITAKRVRCMPRGSAGAGGNIPNPEC